MLPNGELTSRQPGVGKGNWSESIPRLQESTLMPVRPPKEEREKKAAEKRATGGKGDEGGAAEVEEDAEGEEE